MSGTPKRSHEDTLHPSSKHPHDDSSTYSKLVSASNEYHVPYDIGQDSRAAKTSRTDLRDADRKSPLPSVYRITSASNDSHPDHPPGIENKIEAKDSKDNKDFRFENRDSKIEKKDFHIEARRDAQSSKNEKDLRVECRGDDNKDVKYDRESHNESKCDKTEKDGYGVVSSHLNWKESKDYHRGKRYSDSPSGSLDTWQMTRGNTQGPLEARKESSITKDRDHVEAHEAVGENKEDKDLERSEKEKKDHPKERENSKDREKDQIKKDPLNGMDKEVPNTDKKLGDGLVKLPEQEIVLPEQKKQKDADSWKNVDREAKEKRKDRDADLEGDKSDRPDKRNRGFDKESDDGCADVEGTVEKEKEPYNFSAQQRKRIQRSRGSPQVPNREPRFRSRSADNDGSQGMMSFCFTGLICERLLNFC
ncbi:hypothetical protein PIB30_085369, partial [Stylosanthes scabra]|nr:hypothetical protein [Stylosanthes scabra]